MSDYISRKAALKLLCKAACNVPNCECDRVRCPEWFAIHDAPAADVRPVVKAKWEQANIMFSKNMDNEMRDSLAVATMFCPKCKRYHNEVYIYGDPTEMVRFCPNCGADMRGEQDV